MVVRPLGGKTRPFVPISISWTIGLVCTPTCLAAVHVSEYFTSNQAISCRILFNFSWFTDTLQQYRLVFVMFTQYIIPLAMTAILYYYVLKAIKKRSVVGNTNTLKEQVIEKAKKRTVQMLIVVVTAFVATRLPAYAWYMKQFFAMDGKDSKCGGQFLHSLACWFAISSCCINPFIYCIFNDLFRAEAVRHASVLLCGYEGFDKYIYRTQAELSMKKGPQESGDRSAVTTSV